MTARRKTSLLTNSGFTLLEIMMAMLIMTVGLLGLLQSIQVAYRHNAKNKMRERAVVLADDNLRSFSQLPFEKITARNVQQRYFISDYVLQNNATSSKGNFVVIRDCQPLGTDSIDCKNTDGNSKMLTVTVASVFRNATTKHVIYTVKKK
jgi:type IV pilus assembly protein PilV